MGDMSEMRGLIVVGSFLFMLVSLIGWMPPQFFGVPDVSGNRKASYPEGIFESSSIMVYNDTYTHHLTFDYYYQPWGKNVTGHDMVFFAFELTGQLWIENDHVIPRIPFTWYGSDYHKMNWINSNGEDRGGDLVESEISEDMGSESFAEYKVQCSHFYMTAVIGYNSSAYANVGEAWHDSELYVAFGIDWSQKGTANDAWSLISGVLFFQAPSIDFYTNLMIATPIWLCMGYLVFILVLRAIGAVFGGGA